MSMAPAFHAWSGLIAGCYAAEITLVQTFL